ncbi:MAG: diguanylate cyclase [Lentisphaerae bacterium]|nr:diguanylate cyclase [Lentisphaerota bacterium]
MTGARQGYEAGGGEGGAIRVLVLDDEQAIRRVYAMGMQERGFEVETADSGRGALQVLMQQTFDVLVVDLKMQGMDGIVFLQEALKIWPWLGVIVVSGYVTQDAMQRAEKLGVTRVLQKPVELRELCEAVSEEAAAKRRNLEPIPKGHALALMRDHLKLLTRLEHGMPGADTLFQALSEFGQDLARMLVCDVVGLLVLAGDERVLLLTSEKAVSESYLHAVRREMTTRYEVLSGRKLRAEDVRVERRGAPPDASGPARPETTLSVPIILGRDVSGVLTLATEAENPYTPTDVSLLYHAANHISAVFIALRQMHHLATQDPLTGVYNRIRLEEELERSWLLTQRYGASMGVVVVDVDHFKTLNDAYGHAVGDEILREFSRILESVARASDIIARYGGDEFVAILPQAREEDACAFSERLMQSTREHVFCPKTHELRLTISVGIATSLNPTKPATSGELLSQADRALYTAKRAGRDRAAIWPHHSRKEAVREGGGEAEDTVSTLPVVQVPGRIVLVDDESAIRDLLRMMLERDGYVIKTCATAQEAIDAVQAEPGYYDVVLTDLGLPRKSGIDLLRDMSEIDESIVRIVMTGYATVDNAVNCLRQGAYDFIQKPVGRSQLSALIKRALEYRELRLERSRYQAHLEDMVRERSAQLAELLEAIRKSYEFTLEALVGMLDAREHQTGTHSLRTRELTLILARHMGLDENQLETVAHGALLHDIGKIGIPDTILLRPGPLAPDEWETMKKHPEIGYNILRSSPYLGEAADIVREHQENFDGSGYPAGLRGEEICIGARIFRVIDAYDAMRSARVYSAPLSEEEALREITENSGKQFDPQVVEAFLECREAIEACMARPEA